MKRDDIPVLQPITGQVNLDAAMRLRRFLELDTRPLSSLSEAERAELDKMEEDLAELELLNFRESVEAGDTEAARKAFFGSNYEALKAAYERQEERLDREYGL